MTNEIKQQIEKLKEVQLSENFNLYEYIESATAFKMGIREQYFPSEEIVENIKKINVRMQRVRTARGKSMDFTSAYRCKKLNKIVGGVADSEHLDCTGVDIAYSGFDDAMDLIGHLVAEGFKRIGLGNGFIHADQADDKPSPAVWLYGKNTPVVLAAKRSEILKMMK